MFSTLKKKTNNNGQVNILSSIGGFSLKKSGQVICDKSISKHDKEAIVELYEALVPRKERKLMDVKKIHEFFPSFDDIDINMIINEGFPMFEKTIGVQNFGKIKKYFGIACKSSKKQCNQKEIDELISNLRTIENAQYYICGFKELISKLANLLDEGEIYTELEKAKLVRMQSILFFGYYYFVEDFVSHGAEDLQRVSIDFDKVESNNKKGFYPEELFVHYVSKYTHTPEKSLFYDSIIFEFNKIQESKIVNDVLKFAELDYKDGKFLSINEANPFQNFGKIRGIKNKIYYEPGVFPVEVFSVKPMAERFDLGGLLGTYKVLRTHNIEDLKKIEEEFMKFEGSRIYKSKCECYEVITDVSIGGELERKRFINLVEKFAHNNWPMYIKYSLKTGERFKRPKKYNMGQLLGCIIFVNDAKLVNETDVARDFEIANELIKRDEENFLYEYYCGKISIDEVKNKLKIDEAFEYEFFGIKPEIKYKDIISDFGLKNGYVKDKEEIDFELIENVLISGNEELIEKYHSGEIDEERFKRELGITPEFSEVYFNLSKIDIPAIESILLEIKKNNYGKKKFDSSKKLLVLLYCYIIEGQIACGPKNRVPKRNKGLKPSILKTLI